MERTELMAGEGLNRLRAGRLSRHRPDGKCRRVPDDRMLRKWTALMLFAPFPTNSVLSNAGEFRPQYRHIVGFSMQNRAPMTRLNGASELPHSNKESKFIQCRTPRTPPARGPAVAEYKYVSPT
jgi:hypothetical protein